MKKSHETPDFVINYDAIPVGPVGYLQRAQQFVTDTAARLANVIPEKSMKDAIPRFAQACWNKLEKDVALSPKTIREICAETNEKSDNPLSKDDLQEAGTQLINHVFMPAFLIWSAGQSMFMRELQRRVNEPESEQGARGGKPSSRHQ